MAKTEAVTRRVQLLTYIVHGCEHILHLWTLTIRICDSSVKLPFYIF